MATEIKQFTEFLSLKTIILFLFFYLVFQGTNAMAQSFSPFSTFDQMTSQELQSLQIQFTSFSPSGEILPPVTFRSAGNVIDINAFTPFRRPGYPYSNVPGETFSVSIAELETLLNNLSSLPAVTAGGVDVSPAVSFAMVGEVQSNPVGFEAIINLSDAGGLFDQVRSAFASNGDALFVIASFACPLDLVGGTVATDITAMVLLDISGLRLNRNNNRYVATATITNNSAQSFPAPISLVFTMSNNVTLARPDGFTCKNQPVGSSYLNLPGSLNVGQTIQLTVEFNNPDSQTITPAFKVLSGSGTR